MFVEKLGILQLDLGQWAKVTGANLCWT